MIVAAKPTSLEIDAGPAMVLVGASEPAKPAERLEVIDPPAQAGMGQSAPAEDGPPGPSPTGVTAWEGHPTQARKGASSLPACGITPPPLPQTAASAGLNRTLTQAPPARGGGEPRRRPKWAAWARGEESGSYDVVRATPRQLEMVYWLACLLPFAAVFTAAPAVPHIQFAGAPIWAQALLGIACLQLVYAAWLATVPDFSGVHVGVCLLAAVAALELLAAVGLPFLPESFLSFAGLSGARAAASAWCGLAAVVNGIACASCRWLERRWRSGQL
ncbi:MAG TPA: hypothetical protein VF278_13890 [Pirellulales bacterium]